MNLQTQLTQLESAQLVRRLLDDDPAYIFKHALTQDAASHSILKTRRTELHRQVAQTYEQLYPERLDELGALLAHHFEQADEPRCALDYLQRAAEWARRSAAHREEVALLARAIVLAEREQLFERVTELHARRGKALANLTEWREAMTELELALAQLPPTQSERRVQVLLELALATQWAWDVPRSLEFAREALALAEAGGMPELAARAMCQLAVGETSDGRTRDAIAHFENAFARAPQKRASLIFQGIQTAGLAYYWIGEFSAAVNLNREAISGATEHHDNVTIVFGLSNLGLALMGKGEYADALDTFDRACEFARLHDVKAFHARALAMLGGLHLDLFDYAGAEAIAHEARRIGRLANFPPAVISAAIDLMLNYARRGEIHRAEQLAPEIIAALPKTYGSHRWLWELRFAQARAELALAKEAWHDALTFAESAIAQSDTTSRIKYKVAAIITQGQALAALGCCQDARAMLDTAVELARPVGDPAMFLRAAIASLALNGKDALAAEARDTAHRVFCALPDEAIRQRFAAIVSEWL